MKTTIASFICSIGCVLCASHGALAQEQTQSPPPVQSQAQGRPQGRPGPMLTLGEAIRRALSKGFDMEIERESLIGTRENLPIAKSVFRPVLSAAATENVTKVKESDDGTVPASRSEGLNTNIGVTQRIITGTSVTLGTNLNRSNINPSFAALNPAYASDATLSINQSLLQGFGTSVNRIGIRSAEVGIDIAERSYEDRALDVIQQTENAYYTLAATREQLAVFKSSLTLAEKLLQEAQARRQAGLAIGLDVLQAEVGVSNAKRSVIEAENAVQGAEDSLLALMGRFELDTQLGDVRLTEPSEPEAPQIDASYALAKEHQPQLLNARASLELAQLSVRSAKDQLKPRLDLGVALGVNGSDRSGPDALSDAFSYGNNSWQAGLALSYPIGRTGEKARYRQSRSDLTRQELGVEQLEQTVLVQVRSAVRDVQTNIESVKLATQSATLSEKQYELEIARFRSGLSTSRRVLEAQTDLESARVAELQAKLNLQTSLASLRRIEGTALDHYGIELPKV